MKTKSTDRPFGLRDKIAYAAGDLGCNMSFSLKSQIMFLFWTQFMLLGDTLYATLLLVVQIWDAVNDPLLGSLFDADKRRYKHGKFKSYVFVGAFGLLFSGVFFFLPLHSAAYWLKIVVFLFGYILWDAFYTLANVPYGSMMSVITDIPSQRAQLSTWRSIGSMLGNIFPMALLPFLCYDSQNNLIGNNVFLAALIMGVIGLFCFLFMLRNTTIRVNEYSIHIHDTTKQKFHLLQAMKNFIRNRAAVGATIAAMAMFIGMNSSAAATQVLFQSYFRNAQISGIIALISYLPMFFLMPFIKKIVEKLGKKEGCAFGALVSAIGGLLLFNPLITPDVRGMIFYVLAQLIFGLGLGFYSCVSWALMADAIDYNEWKNGAKEEGTIYSLHSFFRKLAQGVGPSLVVVLMTALGYDSAQKADQPMWVATNMRWLVAALFAFSGIVMYLAIQFIYNLDKKSMEHITDELHTRRSSLRNRQNDNDAPCIECDTIAEDTANAAELSERKKH